MRKSAFVLIIACLHFSLTHAQNGLLLRHPSTNHDGSLVAFSFQGDIWTVPSSGGKATRLTIHEAYESNPVFSADGKFIAFSGNRYGNNDIFVMPADGGTPRRLTYHSAADNIASWNGDQVLFNTNREFRRIERDPEMYAISAKGGTEYRIADVLGFEPVTSPNGRFIAFVRGGSNPVAREDYKGSSNREIWIMDTKSNSYSKLPLFATNDVMPKWSGNNTLYFLSSNAGTYNLYKIGIGNDGKNSGTAQQVTNFKDDAIRHFDVSTDGSTIVFEKDMNLYVLRTNKNSPEKLNVQISADQRMNPSETKTFNNAANEYTLSPNGKLMAFSVRGEVFIKEADKDKSRSVNVSNHPYRDMSPVWLNDSALIFTSDRAGGNFNLYLVRSVDTNEVNLFRTLKPSVVQLTNSREDITSPIVSPDSKKIAFVRGRGKLVVADVVNGQLKNEKTLSESWSNPSGIAWSPDSKWLAYSQSDLYANFEIYIQAADGSKKPVNVTMHPRTENNPVWSPDGTKLAFLSQRNNRNADVWFIWLRKEDWEKSNEDWQDMPAADAAGTARSSKQAKPVQIDFDDISKRTVQVTSFPGDEGAIVISKDGQTFYYTANTSTARGRDLYSVRWDGKELKELTKGGTNPTAVRMDNEGKYLYFMRQGGSFARIDAKSALQEQLPFSAKLKIDYTTEREQVFEEAWRTMRDQFYDPKMHGYDWKALHDKYRERAIAASTSPDFRDMFNLMLGELNSSHQGFVAADRVETARETTALIGAELKPAAGGMQVLRVLPDGPAAKTAVQLKVGDVITAVNGEPVKADENFYNLLNGYVNEKILLSVKPINGAAKEVVIRPIASEADALYNEWVEDRRKLVDKYSNGRIGYIHIQAMNMESFENTEREFMAAGYGKDALVIDVRYNGGGSTTDYLMTVLNYKQHAYTVPRGASEDLERDKLKFRDYYPLGERLIYSAWLKPSIAICNESSYSNAEIFSHAYKQLGIGKLVGVPTNGSVISTGSKSFIDGSTLRLPTRGWFVKATDMNQELGPAVPDIIVENPLDYAVTGEDVQLKVAVDELLKQLPAKR